MCRVCTGEQKAECAWTPGSCALLSLKREERTHALLLLSAFAIMAMESQTRPPEAVYGPAAETRTGHT